MPACRFICSTSFPKDASNRNAIAEAAIKKLLEADPAPFMHKNNAPPDHARQYRGSSATGWPMSTGSSRPSSKTCKLNNRFIKNWTAVCREDCLISSNTSTLPLALLTQGSAGKLHAAFHDHAFLQPAPLHAAAGAGGGPQTRPELVEAVSRFADIRLGKDCVHLQGHARLYRQPHRHILAAMRPAGGDRTGI